MLASGLAHLPMPRIHVVVTSLLVARQNAVPSVGKPEPFFADSTVAVTALVLSLLLLVVARLHRVVDVPAAVAAVKSLAAAMSVMDTLNQVTAVGPQVAQRATPVVQRDLEPEWPMQDEAMSWTLDSTEKCIGRLGLQVVH